jgi:hypothetical protein
MPRQPRSLPAVYFLAGLPQILCLTVYRNIFQGKMMPFDYK